MQRFKTLILMAFVALSFQAHGLESGIDKRQIIIGQNITLQEGKNNYGVEVQTGIQALLRDVNRAGGVHGRKIILRTLDDDNVPAKAETNTKQLIDDGVFVMFGSIEGGPSIAVMKAATAQNVPFFGPMAGSPELRRAHQQLVFPVRAEHREEFISLIRYGASTGLKKLAFFHADSDTGRLHLQNVTLAVADAKLSVALAVPFKSDISDVQLDEAVRQMGALGVDMILNHGSPAVYEKLLRKIRAAGLRIQFLAVNSGSTQLASGLGPLAMGMIFGQVVPNPWARKTFIVREYQEAFRRRFPERDFSYGSLEGYLTAKAFVTALNLAGPKPTRSSFVNNLTGQKIDLGSIELAYYPGNHADSVFVDLALVTRDGKFLQ